MVMKITIDPEKALKLREAFKRPRRIRERKRVHWYEKLKAFLGGYGDGSKWSQAIVIRFPSEEGFFKKPSGKEKSLLDKFMRVAEGLLVPSKAIGVASHPIEVGEEGANPKKRVTSLEESGPPRFWLFPTNRRTAWEVLKREKEVEVSPFSIPSSKKTLFYLGGVEGVVERNREGGLKLFPWRGIPRQYRIVTERGIEEPKNPQKGILRPEEVEYSTPIPKGGRIVDFYPPDEFSPTKIKKELEGKGVIFL